MFRRNAGYLLALLGLLAVGLVITISAIQRFNRSLGAAAPLLTPSATATATVAPSATPSPSPTTGPTPDGQERTARVPILMYHYISDPPPGSDQIRIDLSVGPQAFEEQLVYLKEAGYTTIGLADLTEYLATGRPLPAKPIILTFDDGYEDHFANALPLLSRYGFQGTFFIVTSFLDEGRAGYISWDQAIQMQRAGMEVGAHGVTHTDLRQTGSDALQQQLGGAREALESHLGTPVRYFCYPSGGYNDLVIDAVRTAGYWGAVTTQYGADHKSSAPYEFPRLRIHGQASLDDFEELLAQYS